MKKATLCAVAMGLALLIVLVPLSAQEKSFFSGSSQHYRVYTDTSAVGAMEIARKIEAALSLFNDFLHYDLDRLSVPLGVRIFSQKQDYDAHLTRLISETRSDFVFISYSDPNRSELVGFQRPEKDFLASLLHYGFIQLLNAFIPNAPLWLEEGLATYIEYSQYDPNTGTFRWQPNYAWLDSLKSGLRSSNPAERMPLRELLLIDKQGAQARIEAFYPTAWGLVHFLLQSPEKKYNRILWESLALLDGPSSLGQNSARVVEKAFGWLPAEELQSAFETYTLSQMTFNDLVRQGVNLYGSEKLDEARESFESALRQRADNYIPHYYLGLISYQKKDYSKAASHYGKAQELGIDSGLINYALGVNAFADQRYELAAEHLSRAKELDSSAYGEKVDALLKRIEVLR